MEDSRVQEYQSPDTYQFAINAHVRNSDKIPRLDMIKIVAEEVPKLNPTHSVDLKNPDRTILIELFRVSSCCIFSS